MMFAKLRSSAPAGPWLLGAVIGLASLTIVALTSPAQALFVCTTTPTAITCTNTGTATTFSNIANGTNQSAITTNSGTDSGTVSSLATAGGNAALTNSGGIGNGAVAQTASGNATINNSGSIGGSAGAIATSAGNVTLTNFGTVADFATAETGSGNATLTNSGGIGATALASTNTGNATLTNSGSIGSNASAQTGTGNATLISSGSIGGNAFASAITGNTTLTNSGGIGSFAFAFATIGNATLNNSGSIGSYAYAVASNNATLVNSGSIASYAYVYSVNSTASLTNTGSIGDFAYAVGTDNVALANSGHIASFAYVYAGNGNASFTNSGSIGSYAYAVASNNATLVNSGSIASYAAAQAVGGGNGSGTLINYGTIGQYALAETTGSGNALLINYGTVRQGAQLEANGSGSSMLANAGTILGGPNPAIRFSGGPDTLTLLPGSFIVGAIDLVGSHDTVNVNAPNQNLTFNTLAGATVSGTVPYVMVGNRIASIDATALAGADRTMLAFLDSVSGLIGGQTPAGTSSLGGAALGFNGPSYVAANAEEAFAEVLGYAKAPNDAVVFKNPTQTLSDGTTIWAKGFLGQRVQEADGTTLRNVTNFYGGAIGVDRQVQPDLKLGGFVGGGNTQTTIDLNAGGATSDLGFAGIYGRKDFGRVFLDADVIAGGSSNHTTRNINNNLLPGGLETATASFGGWFFSPEAALGARYDVAPTFTLTPAARLRYLAAGFDGYTESGSTANLTLGSRLLQDVEERADLTLTNTTLSDTGRFQVAGTMGVLGLERAGGTALNAVLLGQALSFATPGPSTVGGVYGSVAVDWKTLSGMTLYAAVDYTAYSDSSSIIAGRAGVRIGF